MEFRMNNVELQADENGLLKVGGYINVVETESEILYNKKRGKWFKEVMKRGVFKRAIEKSKEIPLLFEHDWNQKLASTSNSTLSLKEDSVGLKFEAVIENRSVYEKVKAGVINSCSFGFKMLSEKIEPVNSRLEKRFVDSIELLEVSLVGNPAYVSSLCEARSYEEEINSLEDVQAKEKEEVRAEEEEVKTEATEEVVEEETEEESHEAEDESKDKSEEERELYPVEDVAVVENPVPSKEMLTSIVDELIEAKIDALRKAEMLEQQSNEQLEEVKEFHKEIENDLTHSCMKQNLDVVKMRLELIKLNTLREGI